MASILKSILDAVLCVVIPVCSGFVIALIKRLAARLITKTDDTLIQEYIAEVADAVADAVTYVNQTMVDWLKDENGTLTTEQAQEALMLALDKCEKSISADTMDYLETMYGDATEYLTVKIEAEVRREKMEANDGNE